MREIERKICNVVFQTKPFNTSLSNSHHLRFVNCTNAGSGSISIYIHCDVYNSVTKLSAISIVVIQGMMHITCMHKQDPCVYSMSSSNNKLNPPSQRYIGRYIPFSTQRTAPKHWRLRIPRARAKGFITRGQCCRSSSNALPRS